MYVHVGQGQQICSNIRDNGILFQTTKSRLEPLFASLTVHIIISMCTKFQVDLITTSWYMYMTLNQK